jgi:hypothetical protein
MLRLPDTNNSMQEGGKANVRSSFASPYHNENWPIMIHAQKTEHKYKESILGGIDWLICNWVQDLTVLMHLGLNWLALCAPYQFMGALLLCWNSRWPPDLHCLCPLAPRRSPDTHVWVKPKLHIHKVCGPRFHPLLHTSYTVDYLTAPLGEDVSSGYYAQ